jgi:hypothetical protein
VNTPSNWDSSTTKTQLAVVGLVRVTSGDEFEWDS